MIYERCIERIENVGHLTLVCEGNICQAVDCSVLDCRPTPRATRLGLSIHEPSRLFIFSFLKETMRYVNDFTRIYLRIN